MSHPASSLDPSIEDALPITPDLETWRAMSLAERERHLAEALAALQRQAELMPEGSPHLRAMFRLRETLEAFYRRLGRKVYLGSDLPVHYPGQRPFAPDLLAVLDVEDPGDEDWRMAWVVAEEGKGLDLALEILHQGNRRKDLVDNVLWYARLGIPEYFVYDRRKLRVLGYRLPFPSASSYDPIPSRGGMLTSRVLGLELGIVGGHLRFFHGGAEVPETRQVLARVTAMVEELERRAEDEARRADEEARRADEEARRAEDEARRAEDEARRANEAERRAEQEAAARAELERQLAELREKLGQG